jgi:uncharacterized membrane protein YfcA
LIAFRIRLFWELSERIQMPMPQNGARTALRSTALAAAFAVLLTASLHAASAALPTASGSPLFVGASTPEGKGEHVPVLGPTPSVLFGLLFVCIASSLSIAVGVGGGGIIVPIFNVIVGFGIKESTALSQAMISAAGIGSLIYTFHRSHPVDRSLPLIDFSMALVLAPSLLLGIMLGVVGNYILPEWVISFGLVGVLLWLARRTFASAVRLRRAELVGVDAPPEPQPEGGARAAAEAAAAEDQRQLPWGPAALLLTLTIVLGAFQFAKAAVPRCSRPYFALYAGQVAIGLAATVLAVRKVVQRAEDGGSESDNLLELLENGPDDGSESSKEDGNADNAAAGAYSQRHLMSAAAVAAGSGVLAGVIGLGGLVP